MDPARLSRLRAEEKAAKTHPAAPNVSPRWDEGEREIFEDNLPALRAVTRMLDDETAKSGHLVMIVSPGSAYAKAMFLGLADLLTIVDNAVIRDAALVLGARTDFDVEALIPLTEGGSPGQILEMLSVLSAHDAVRFQTACLLRRELDDLAYQDEPEYLHFLTPANFVAPAEDADEAEAEPSSSLFTPGLMVEVRRQKDLDSDEWVPAIFLGDEGRDLCKVMIEGREEYTSVWHIQLAGTAARNPEHVATEEVRDNSTSLPDFTALSVNTSRLTNGEYNDTFIRVLCSIPNAAEKWTALQRSGASDAKIKALLSEMPTGGESQGQGWFEYKGGTSPEFLHGHRSPINTPMKGGELVTRTRVAMRVPYPAGALTIWYLHGKTWAIMPASWENYTTLKRQVGLNNFTSLFEWGLGTKRQRTHFATFAPDELPPADIDLTEDEGAEPAPEETTSAEVVPVFASRHRVIATYEGREYPGSIVGFDDSPSTLIYVLLDGDNGPGAFGPESLRLADAPTSSELLVQAAQSVKDDPLDEAFVEGWEYPAPQGMDTKFCAKCDRRLTGDGDPCPDCDGGNA